MLQVSIAKNNDKFVNNSFEPGNRLNSSLSMKETIKYIIGILETLPFWTVTAIVGVFSALVTFGVTRGPLLKFKWIVILTVPFPIAYSVYWAPVWLGANVSEYAVWAPLFIIPWYLASVALTVLLLHLAGKLKRGNKSRPSG